VKLFGRSKLPYRLDQEHLLLSLSFQKHLPSRSDIESGVGHVSVFRSRGIRDELSSLLGAAARFVINPADGSRFLADVKKAAVANG
jgi:hypothetical protein